MKGIMTWAEASRQKIIPPHQIGAKVAELRKAGKKIATLNGSFDLLHAGHLQIIYEAAQAGDVLIVALNTDRSIQQYKSSLRPIVPLEYRLEMMAAISFVDYITWFDELDPRNILEIIKPDVHVNGAQYPDSIEAATVKAHGGKIHLAQFIPGLSTSQIVKKIASITAVEEKN